ncbi:MAG: tetratricopeptide repeat protein [Longimicrobiaceae bacterium]
MSRRIPLLSAAGVLACLSLFFYVERGGGRSVDTVRSLKAAPAMSAREEGEHREEQIRFFDVRASRDSTSALDRAWLAKLYLQRSRATGGYDDVLRAERYARESLSLLDEHNTGSRYVLAVALLDQHRFVEAHAAARDLVEREPEPPANRALLAKTQMELGRYDDARVTFRSLEPARYDLAVMPDLARWEELTGHGDQARELLERARDEALRRTGLTPGQRLVFHFLLADFELRAGRFGAAERELRTALAEVPGDARLLSEMARLEALRHDWRAAIRYGEAAIAARLDPATLGVMSDAYAALGDSAGAAEYAEAMQTAVRSQQQGFHREWGLFLLDHGGNAEDVRSQAEQDLRSRKDIYGYDLLAWALHKQGRNAEARRAMQRALRLGTDDALLFYHAGMIDHALGADERAARELRRALELNPRFHPTHPATARKVLDSLEGSVWSRLPFGGA